ncbi:MAG: class I SAM-dependent methyltransferase [Candidatus Thorarchaeota archaeon]
MERLVIEHFEDRIEKQEYIGQREMKPLPDHLEGRLLEVGCGARLTYAPMNSEVCGIDISLKMARYFTKNHPIAQMVVADARALPFRKGSFDIAVMNKVLHHLVGRTPHESLHNATNALNEVKRILRHTGTLLLIELVSRSFLFSLVIFYTTLLCAKLGIDIDLLDIHSGVVTFFYTDAALKQISSIAGFTIKESELACWKLLKLELGRQVTYSLSRRPTEPPMPHDQ